MKQPFSSSLPPAPPCGSSSTCKASGSSPTITQCFCLQRQSRSSSSSSAAPRSTSPSPSCLCVCFLQEKEGGHPAQPGGPALLHHRWGTGEDPSPQVHHRESPPPGGNRWRGSSTCFTSRLSLQALKSTGLRTGDPRLKECMEMLKVTVKTTSDGALDRHLFKKYALKTLQSILVQFISFF